MVRGCDLSNHEGTVLPAYEIPGQIQLDSDADGVSDVRDKSPKMRNRAPGRASGFSRSVGLRLAQGNAPGPVEMLDQSGRELR